MPNIGWVTFEESANDHVWSAKGELGYWCVQLVIQDGGANGADGTANGSIADSSSVAVANSSNTAPQANSDIVA